ncbi:60S ribosomal protein L13 [Conglomerata obtusa]
MKNNHPIPHNHFKKTAIKYRTPFHLKARAAIRATRRADKASRMYPAPLKKLRSIVRCPTLRHNKKERLGRGFTPEECEAAGINYNLARTRGVSVDLRRRNQNKETFDQNVERLRTYLSKVVVFENRKEARQSKMKQHNRIIMPIVRKKPVVGEIKISEIESKMWAADKVAELLDEVKYKREKN